MANGMKSRAQKQLFWTTLFKEKKLASQLASLATEHVNGITFDDIPQFGHLHVKVGSGSKIGDNFQSDKFIVTAQITPPNARDDTSRYTLSTFVKVLPSNPFMRQMACESRSHPREINIYQNFFGLLREMQVDQLIPLDVPDVYYTHLEEIVQGESDGSGTCTLLENLKAAGYRMADKVEGIDYRHCHMALTSLAHYHALAISAMRKWKDPSTGELSHIPPSAKFIEEKTFIEVGILKMVENASKSFLDFAQEVERPDLGEWLAELLPRLSEIILMDTVESSGQLGCVLHGDYWINNMLFKYSDESQTRDGEKSPSIPVSLRMIDFQQSRIGHPLNDILYFFYTSTRFETRQKHMLVLLRYYFDTLAADLRLLGISLDDCTWQDFLAEYKKRSLMWMFLCIMLLANSLNKKALEMGMETIKGEVGMSVEMEEMMKTLMASYKLSDNPILSDRILKLMDEVKALLLKLLLKAQQI
ncbi:hypothetical protein DAPPUDRAFT_314376 [Daphnia pulex]|uniref:CHK kinase-like domain-containing protein n=1 Tax=Daphnia pulex TaxID=6669 RepID=E9G5X1_DAPPU|nr:hypothetical protein DAPPUDRAFT_314376 [Daphnia pulex]|eukprot:EFX85098.1 hypothetical protein DAPPUDRAFT_314376 [Daphnia pulex]